MENNLKEGTTITRKNKNQLYSGDIILYCNGFSFSEGKVFLISNNGVFFLKKTCSYNKGRTFVKDESLSCLVFVRRGKEYIKHIKLRY